MSTVHEVIRQISSNASPSIEPQRHASTRSFQKCRGWEEDAVCVVLVIKQTDAEFSRQLLSLQKPPTDSPRMAELRT
jgi:hypothetical protein